ncbi:hypothetical protein [Streptomyces sp. NPDC005799]|uniref:hypothetical protein n=1 Tax=Streptomyces sp. NPDC005799 TaxID=3154678 RepID=UPI003403F286
MTEDCSVRWMVGPVPGSVRGAVAEAGVGGCASEAVVVAPPSGSAGAPLLGLAVFGADVAAVRWTGVGFAVDAAPDRCAMGGAAGLGAFAGVVLDGAPDRCAVDAVVGARCTEGAAGEPVAVPAGSVRWVGVVPRFGADVGAVLDVDVGCCDAGVVGACSVDVGFVSDVVRGWCAGAMARCTGGDVGVPAMGAVGPVPWTGVPEEFCVWVGALLGIGPARCGAGAAAAR